MPTAPASSTRLPQLLSDTTRTTHMQFVRYLFVGAIACAADFGTLVLLAEWCHLDYLLAAAMGFCVGLVINYFLSVGWVFHRRNIRHRQTEFAIFCTVGVAGLAFTELILYAGTNLSGLDYRLSKVFAVGVVLFWNFGMRKLLLFQARE